jgi:hypothetical protein
MNQTFLKSQIAVAVAAALGAGALGTAPDFAGAQKVPGRYASGDFHNHTTCSDGSTSLQKLVRKATDSSGKPWNGVSPDTPWGLDWFVQAGHGNSGGTRNCTLTEDASLDTPVYPFLSGNTPFNVNSSGQPANPATVYTGPNTLWSQSIGTNNVLGDQQPGNNPPAYMWRWQSVQQYEYPLIEYLNALKGLPLFLGLESIVAGHEHSSMSVIDGQIPLSLDTATLPTSPGPLTARYSPVLGNADALAKWAYCFDLGVTDRSRGAANQWDCTNPGSSTSTDPNLGWNTSALKLIPAANAGAASNGFGSGLGTKGHLKTLEALKWMAYYSPNTSYYVPAHLERAGPFDPDSNKGFNIEHLRNFNNTAPNIAFGFETQPGHGASSERGEYFPSRNRFATSATTTTLLDSVGGTTYGGTGVYGAQIGGVWDALLGEGRNWWFFASSDWHNRGLFGGDDRRSTQDFFPGEYQRNYTMVRTGLDDTGNYKKIRPQTIVDGLRTGNNWVAAGQLIDRLAFIACASYKRIGFRSNATVESYAVNAALNNTDIDVAGCATMGEKLKVRPGADIVVSLVVRNPSGPNFSPYSFPNPSLAQVGINQPLNQPVLDHVDVIQGLVTSTPKQSTDPDYAGAWPNAWITAYLNNQTPSLSTVPNAAKNTTAAVYGTFNSSSWTTVANNPEFKVMTFRIPAVQASQYVRVRGTNLPKNVPSETDASGNPLPDVFTNATTTVVDGTQGKTPTVGTLRIPCNNVIPDPAGGPGTPFTPVNVPANSVLWTQSSGLIDGCPNHLPVVNGQKYVAYDVAAWADLWFYSNPIYVEVGNSVQIVGVQ